MKGNPFNWQSAAPPFVILRPEVGGLVEDMRRGKVAMLHSGRGMGKSVLLRAVEKELRVLAGFKVVRIGAPEEQSLPALIRDKLAISHRAALSDDILHWLDRNEDQRLVFLIDELDGWVAPSRQDSTGAALNALAAISRDDAVGRLGVLTAGGISNLLLERNPYGSGFTSRAHRVYLGPFGLPQIRELLAQFSEMPNEEWEAELLLASGGIPLLVCAVLQQHHETGVGRPLEFLTDFLSRHGFSESVRSSIATPEHPEAVSLLSLISRGQGAISQAEVDQALPRSSDQEPALTLLIHAGLVKATADRTADPWWVRVNPSVLVDRLVQRPRARVADPWVALVGALGEVRDALVTHAADWYQGEDEKRKMVPESVFSAAVALFLSARGFDTRREQLQGAGRTDIRVSGGQLDGHVIIEVKIWGRNDYADVEAQLQSYALRLGRPGSSTAGLVAIMVSQSEVEMTDYEDKIAGPTSAHRGDSERTWVRSVDLGGVLLPLHHVLVCLPRRRKQ
jgi:hypothetical protein